MQDFGLHAPTYPKESRRDWNRQYAWPGWVSSTHTDLDSLLELKNFLTNIKRFANRNIIAGYIYPKNQSPRYWMAATIEAVAIVLAIVTTLAFREVLRRENKRLDQREWNELGNQYTNEAGKKNFRYVL